MWGRLILHGDGGPRTRARDAMGGRPGGGGGEPARPRAEIGARCRRRRRRARSDNQLGPEGGKALGGALAKGAFPAIQTVNLRWVRRATCLRGRGGVR